MMTTLSQQDRDRFAAYLEEDARQGEELAEQAAKMPNMEAAVKMLRVEAAAAKIIARKLRMTESAEIRRG